MPDQIGRITVPEIPANGTFPFTTDYPHGMSQSPRVIVHPFGSGNAKIEQRYLIGMRARKFTFQRQLSIQDLDTLKTFWEARQGAYEPFTYNVHLDGHGQPATAVTVRFSDPSIDFEQLTQAITTTGIEFSEEITTGPTYTLNRTLERFHDTALESASLGQVQELIPLIRIRVKEAAVSDIYLSNQRVTIGAQLYLARLIQWTEITQSMNGESDRAVFEFGNADRVMTDLANDTDLNFARLEFSLFHVGELAKVDLWAGDVVEWEYDPGEIFRVTCGDPLRELSLPYPTRTIQRMCWKPFDDANGLCPYTAQGTGGDPTKCDKGFATVNGCQAHSMDNFHGGVAVEQQTARVKDNSKGFFGIGRPTITVASILSDSAYGQAIQEIYTDRDLWVDCVIVSGREEGDFYAALGVVGEGPIGSYGTGHLLDNQPHHGPGALGLSVSLGANPNPDPFSIGPSYTADRAAGTAFIELRRADQRGAQISALDEHQMTAVVSQGLSGFRWTAPGARSTVVLTNPIWVAVNAIFRAKHLQFETAANQETHFDVDAAVAAAAICDTTVTKIVGSGTVKQYEFIGVIRAHRPLREWLREILNNCLGYYTFKFGKIKFGIRNDSAVVSAFTDGNMIWKSLRSRNIRPTFNHLTTYFGNEDSRSAGDSTLFYDEDHAKNVFGTPTSPVYHKRDLNLAGTSTRDQAQRIAITRAREEVGGVGVAEYRNAREYEFRTTVLALGTASNPVDPGAVISVTNADVPGGGPTEMRCRSWTLFPDLSIRIEARTTTDNMYDLTAGEKQADVLPGPVPTEVVPDLRPGDVTAFSASEDPFVEDDGTVRSEVTVSYTEPSPQGSFQGVDIWWAPLDTHLADGSGAITAEPSFVTSIPRNDAPSDRRFLMDVLPFAPGVSGAARLWAVSFSTVAPNLLDVANTPNTDVLLDGKDSAPNPVGNIHCQEGVADGTLISWDQSAARDARVYRVANVGDVVPPADVAVSAASNATPIVITTAAVHGRTTGERVEIRQVLGNRAANGMWTVTVLTTTTFELNGSAGSGDYVSGGFMSVVTPEHVIAEVPVDPESPRGTFIFKPKIYRGNSDGTVVSFGQVGDNFWPANAHVVGGVGKNVRFFETDGSVSDHQVVSNTARTITFVAASVPTGEVTVRIEGSDGQVNIYVGVLDTSGNRSDLAPSPPTVLTCSPYAVDRTKDKGFPPQVFPSPTSDWQVHTLLNNLEPGHVKVSIEVQAELENEPDFDLANKWSINGLDKVEVEIEGSPDGDAPFTQQYRSFSLSNERDRYLFRNVPPGFERWNYLAVLPPILIPNFGINQVRCRVRNSHGWGPWGIIPTSMSPNGPHFTGGGFIAEPITAAPEIVNDVYPNLARSLYRAIDSPTATLTIKKPEYRGHTQTAGTGTQLKGGETFWIRVKQGTSKVDVLFDPAYKGDFTGRNVVDTRDGATTVWAFYARGSNEFELVGYEHY